jgi:hypothetical protein
MNEGSGNVSNMFSADEFNAYFTTPATSTGSPNISYPLIQGDSFSFFGVDEMCIVASIRKIKLFLPLILPLLAQLFNFILTSSTFPLVWKISNIISILNVNSPTERTDYRLISFLPALAKSFENVMFEQMAD